MIYGSVCSGIEAASVAWSLLGWTPSFFAEIDAFPSRVLAHRFSDVPNAGDFTIIQEGDHAAIDLLVGGTPCQSFSLAGLRRGLDDDRGNLALEFCRLLLRLRPEWFVWENVPGVLSSGGGEDFRAILGAFCECGYGYAYRVLDAQYVRVDGLERAVPQRRRRVFVVGRLGDWRAPAAVLFEPDSLRGNSPPRRETREGIARDVASCLGASGRGVIRSEESRGQDDLVAHTLRGDGFDASEDGTGRGTPLVAGTLSPGAHPGGYNGQDAYDDKLIAFSFKDHGADAGAVSPTLRSMGSDTSHQNSGGHVAVAIQERACANGDCGPGGKGFRDDGAAYTLEARHHAQVVAFDSTQITSAKNYSNPKSGDPCHPITAGGHPPAIAINMRGRDEGAMPELSDVANIRAASGGSSRSCVYAGMTVRRLTPLECERLQGFPDYWTAIPVRRRAIDGLEADYLRYHGFPVMSGADGKLYTDIAADGPRYKAIGNSMAVNCMRWIGRRIALIIALEKS